MPSNRRWVTLVLEVLESMPPPAPGALQGHPSMRPPPLRRNAEAPLSVHDFAIPTTELRLPGDYVLAAVGLIGGVAIGANVARHPEVVDAAAAGGSGTLPQPKPPIIPNPPPQPPSKTPATPKRPNPPPRPPAKEWVPPRPPR